MADFDHPLTHGNVYSLVVVPARGRMKLGEDINTFSIEDNGSEGEIFYLMSQLAEKNIAFLSLDDKIFSNNKILVNFHYNQLNYKVKNHFDGFILLPEVKYIGYIPSD